MADAQVSIAQHYHSRTKYDPATLSAKARPIDFARQPVPFKTYQIGSEVDLKPYLEVSASRRRCRHHRLDAPLAAVN